jgi:hypothetical protein
MPTRRGLLGFSLGLAAAPWFCPAEAAANPFALGVDWAQRWTRYRTEGSGSTIIGKTNGIEIRAGSASQWLLSKTALSVPAGKGLRIRFRAVDLTGFAGTAGNESMLLYAFMEGNGSAGHPKNVSIWPGMTGSVQMERWSFGYRTTFAPRGTDTRNDNHVRVRQLLANDTLGVHRVNDIHNPPGEPFAFPKGVGFLITQEIKGQTFRWTQKRLSTGSTRTLTRVDPGFDDRRTGRIGFRAMPRIAFGLYDLQVSYF